MHLTIVTQDNNLIHAEHVVICLGGGVEGDGTLLRHADLRVEKGVEIAALDSDAVLIMSSSFTLNRTPRMDANGRIISEASAMACAAQALGYTGPLYCEQQSHDTIGSAYFLFSDFLSFLAPRRVTIITSDFHIARAEAIFAHMASLFDCRGTISYVATPADVNADRRDHERRATDSYAHEWARIGSLDAFRHHLFSTHANYNAAFSSNAITPARALSY